MPRELSNSFIAVWRPLLGLKVRVVVVRDIIVTVLECTRLEALGRCVTPVFFILVHGRPELACTSCLASSGGTYVRRHVVWMNRQAGWREETWARRHG